MEQITGYIEHIIFSNVENGYTVFELITDTGEETCVGVLHAVSEGETVLLKGKYVSHAVYGLQFAFEEYEIVEATDEESIYVYLASGAIKGIGESMAGKLIGEFGKDTLKIIEEDPELLTRIKGIGSRKAMEIHEQVISKRDLRRIMMFLQKYGISNNLAVKIYNRYGNDVYRVMEENPYKLADDIEGVGFKTADEIARISGIVVDSVFRIKCGVMYVLSECIADGHTYMPLDLFLAKAQELLGVDRDAIYIQVENLMIESRLRLDNRNGEIRVYHNSFYYMEKNAALMLRELNVVFENDEERIRSEIVGYDSKEEILEQLQIDAVVKSIVNGVCVITGGPGTGKTTTINRLIRYLENHNEDFLLAAPTGRAAKRMTEATGYKASTIQRMLGIGVKGTDEKEYEYDYNENNTFDDVTIIIDEMSMVDIKLFYAVLSAANPSSTRLVLVGDTNQLPSVGPGSVLKDIIASNCFPVVKLEKIYRQNDTSDIIINAHKINAGIKPSLDNSGRDFFFLRRDDINVILKNMIVLITQKLPPYVNAKPYDIQVLTPMKKGPLGVESLNPVLQKYLNPPSGSKKEKEVGSVIFREGDKVMQIHNNYQLEWEVKGKYGIVVENGLGVFNGDTGVIKEIDFYSETMEVCYEENHMVRYPFSGLDDLELAYAVTIHKSQGSEYPAVIIPLLGGPKPLLNRNLLYTAVTRARKCVTILGSESVFAQMVENADETKRYTSFDERIKEVYMEENG